VDNPESNRGEEREGGIARSLNAVIGGVIKGKKGKAMGTQINGGGGKGENHVQRRIFISESKGGRAIRDGKKSQKRGAQN